MTNNEVEYIEFMECNGAEYLLGSAGSLMRACPRCGRVMFVSFKESPELPCWFDCKVEFEKIEDRPKMVPVDRRILHHWVNLWNALDGRIDMSIYSVRKKLRRAIVNHSFTFQKLCYVPFGSERRYLKGSEFYRQPKPLVKD